MRTTARHWDRCLRRRRSCLSWLNFGASRRAMKGPQRTKVHLHGVPDSVDVGPLCRSVSATRLAISATVSRWRHQVGGTDDRKYPEAERWTGVVELFRKFAETYTSPHLLWKNPSPHSPPHRSPTSRTRPSSALNRIRIELRRADDDRNKVSMLRGPGSAAEAASVVKAKRRWSLPEQTDPLEYQDERPNCEGTRRSNCASLVPL